MYVKLCICGIVDVLFFIDACIVFYLCVHIYKVWTLVNIFKFICRTNHLAHVTVT